MCYVMKKFWTEDVLTSDDKAGQGEEGAGHCEGETHPHLEAQSLQLNTITGQASKNRWSFSNLEVTIQKCKKL